jgi:hypothetical protein
VSSVGSVEVTAIVSSVGSSVGTVVDGERKPAAKKINTEKIRTRYSVFAKNENPKSDFQTRF